MMRFKRVVEDIITKGIFHSRYLTEGVIKALISSITVYNICPPTYEKLISEKLLNKKQFYNNNTTGNLLIFSVISFLLLAKNKPRHF